MSEYNLKKICAKEALKQIKPKSIIGFGGGSTIAYLIGYIKEANLDIKVVTPSFKTKSLCFESGLEVLHTSLIDEIDIAFDGCDEVDENLNAIKSGGGIHTREKLIASMAKDYVLLVDYSKYVKVLTNRHPVVLEIIEDSLSYVQKEVKKLGGNPKIRDSKAKDGCTITDGGNLLIDVEFESIDDVYLLEKKLKNICGVIDTSLFINVVTKILVTGKDGTRIISKNK